MDKRDYQNCVTLLDHVGSHIGLESLGDADAFLTLIVLEEGSYDAGKSERTTVEGVAEFDLLVLSVAVAAVETIGLIAVEVAH